MRKNKYCSLLKKTATNLCIFTVLLLTKLLFREQPNSFSTCQVELTIISISFQSFSSCSIGLVHQLQKRV